METNNKLREALKTMCNLIEQGVICTSYANSTEEVEQIEELYRKTQAALAAPPRNCEVGTAKEQSARFDMFCYDRRSYEKGCGGCPLIGEPCCEFAWAQMPYEEGGAK